MTTMRTPRWFTHARSRAAGASGRDTGSTLIELLVVISLLSLMIGFLTTFTMGTLRNSSRINTQQQDTQQAKLALDTVTRGLRGAVPINTSPVTLAFSQANANAVTFYANNGTVTGALTNNGPTLVQYYVDTTAHTLVEASTPAAANPSGSATPYSWPAANTRTRVIATNLLNPQPSRPDIAGPQPNGGPIFSFFDSTGAAVPVDSNGAVTGAALATVRQVEVWLSLRSGPAASSGVTSVVGRVQIVTGFDPDRGSGS